MIETTATKSPQQVQLLRATKPKPKLTKQGLISMTSVVKFPGSRDCRQPVDIEPGVATVPRKVRVLYRLTEAAELMSLSLSTIYNLIDSGDLPVVMVGTKGKTRRIAAADIEAYVDNHREVAESSWAVGI